MKALFRLAAIASLIVATSTQAQTQSGFSDAYVMGAGNWACGDFEKVLAGDDPTKKTELFAWIMGAWTYASRVREQEFANLLGQVGPKKIIVAVRKECDQTQPERPVFDVVFSMIDNTKTASQ